MNLHARFLFDEVLYTGTISNLSGTGMYIKMDMGLYYYKPRFNVQLLLNNGLLEIPVKLSRFVEENGCYYVMGVEVVDPPKQYLDFVAGLGSSLNSARSEYHTRPQN